ncbi:MULTISPECIES: alginate O-acetyltransferase AlgX-related protein [unclassified Saccharothrix]|uniref:alginate O-acetyltransferase AlgX-related protein n=1 Tax=unclassified Saccharothrix TaxID=2593673 RepID=UPI00307DB083
MSTDQAESSKRTSTSLPALPESFLPVEHALYRPRHSARQRTARYAAVLYFFLPLAMLAVGVRPAEFENRKLAEFPSITDGWGFFTGMEKWASDHLPLRDHAVAAADGISRGVFGEAPKFERPQGPAGPVQTTPPPKDPSLDKPEPTAFANVVEGKDDWLFLGSDIKLACEPTVPPADTLARIDQLRTAVESSGRKFILAVAPNKSTMVADHLPSRYFGKGCAQAARDQFWQKVVTKPGVLDLRPGLRESQRREGTSAYSKTDSHWTHDGSLVLAKAVAETVKPGTTKTWKVAEVATHDRPGDLATLLGREATDPVPSHSIAPDGKTEHVMPPPFEDREPKHLTQDVVPGVLNLKASIVGDSFGYYSSPYVANAFGDAWIQHVEGANKDPQALSRLLAETDVIVVVAAERNLVGGVYPLFKPAVVEAIAAELAAKPRR